eukprot:1945638-Rhodomonas_salina.2
MVGGIGAAQGAWLRQAAALRRHGAHQGGRKRIGCCGLLQSPPHHAPLASPASCVYLTVAVPSGSVRLELTALFVSALFLNAP